MQAQRAHLAASDGPKIIDAGGQQFESAASCATDDVFAENRQASATGAFMTMVAVLTCAASKERVGQSPAPRGK